MAPSFPSRIQMVCDSFAWRGPFLFSLLAVREALRPFVYWYIWQVFDTDISQQIVQPYGKDEIEVKVYAAHDGVTISEQISAMGELSREAVSCRLARGDLIAIGFMKNKPVGYMWIVLSNGLELAFDTYWIVRAGEAIKYGSFVIPAFRGRGIHSCLNYGVSCYLHGRNIRTALSCVSVLNRQSMSLPIHNKRAIAMTVFVARIRGVNWTIRKSFGAPLSTRFSWQNDGNGVHPHV